MKPETATSFKSIFLPDFRKGDYKDQQVCQHPSVADGRGGDQEEHQKNSRCTGAARNSMTSGNLQKTTVEEVSTVEICNSCGIDLSDIEPSTREQCVLYDLEYGLVEKNVVAEIMDCPKFRARIKGRFPENRSGPLQYGVGLQALVINLLVAQMLSLRRACWTGASHLRHQVVRGHLSWQHPADL